MSFEIERQRLFDLAESISIRTDMDWDDAYFKEKFKASASLNSRPGWILASCCAKSFLNSYVTGNVDSKSIDRLICLIFCMTIYDTDSYIVPDSLCKDGKILPIVESIPQLSTVKYLSSFCTVRLNKRYVSAKSAENRSWYVCLYNMLSSNPDKPEELKMLKLAINYMGFLAITLFRLTIKSKDSVVNHIANMFTRRFQRLWTYNSILVKVALPNDKIVEWFCKDFKRFTPCSKKFLAVLVYSFGESDTAVQKNIQRILRDGCLLSLEHVGMGALSWLLKASAYEQCSPNEILKYNGSYTCDSTIKNLKTFLAKYVESESKEYSWPWARMFSDGVFFCLRVQQDPLFSITMLAIATGCKKESTLYDAMPIKQYCTTDIKENSLKMAKLIHKFLLKTKAS